MYQRLALLLAAALALPCGLAIAQDTAGDAFGKQAKYATPSTQAAQAQLDQWLDAIGAEQPARDKVAELWKDAPEQLAGRELLRKIAESMALADPKAKAVLEACSGELETGNLPSFAFLTNEQSPAFARHNLRLLYGRLLCQQRFYDEGRAQLEGLKAEDVVDPASLLFYQSVVYHRLLDKKNGLAAITSLLEDVADSPRRYTSVASLMQDDLKALKDDSLDHISRRMEDVERRLDIGRAGQRVQRVEKSIVDDLDKMIAKLEEEQKKKQQQQQSGGGSQSNKPAPDSRILGGKGPGNVDPKDIGSSNGWGSLPPKDREQALQQIGKDFPPHYRNVIEQYFRRLANEQSRRD